MQVRNSAHVWAYHVPGILSYPSYVQIYGEAGRNACVVQRPAEVTSRGHYDAHVRALQAVESAHERKRERSW
jgi:hypothetical protein